MIFTVVWQPETESDLAEFWLNAQDRDAVTQAANQIDTQLKADRYGTANRAPGTLG